MKRKALCLLAIVGIGAATTGFLGWLRNGSLVVHEWGTFTSLQGSDGIPLLWNPFESSRLPGFVYNWGQPGLGRYPSGLLGFGRKSALITLQRMETPVIYFYSDRELTADVSVRFPKGAITEWYPQAPQVGPSMVRPGAFLSGLDSGLHHCGVSQNFTLASFLESTVKESLIHWPNLKIVPVKLTSQVDALPVDSSGSHYFAARETDSAYVKTDSLCPTNSSPEYEKFLFYRGVGNFATPLSVSMQAESTVSLANGGSRILPHLFLLGVRGNAAAFFCVSQLKPGERRDIQFDVEASAKPLDSVRQELREKIQSALTREGLFPREAAAMVKTWDDSWFQEQGVRVLYILPRAWTDEILPMTINPRPQHLVRVMVGRAELITSGMEQRLATDFAAALKGQSEDTLLADARNLGRFAQPVLEQALERNHVGAEDRGRILTLVRQGVAARP